MSQPELVNLARKRGIHVPGALQTMKGLAYPTPQENVARQQLIKSLDSYDKKRAINWTVVGILVPIFLWLLDHYHGK